MIGIKVTHNNEDLVYYGYSHLQKELGVSKYIVKQCIENNSIYNDLQFTYLKDKDLVALRIKKQQESRHKCVCSFCEKEYFVKQYRKQESFYCSVECRGNFKRKYFKNHLQIKDGLLLCHKCLVYKEVGNYSEDLSKDYRLYKLAICKHCEKLRPIPVSKGFESILRKRLKTAKCSSKSRGLEFDIDLFFLMDLYHKQDGKCAISDEEFDLSYIGNKSLKSISIDRIDSDKGYVKDNIQLVCWVINQMKNDLTMDEFYYWCSKMAAKRKKK